MQRQTGGIPVEEFAPSPHGPPIGGTTIQAYPATASAQEATITTGKRIIGYRPVTLPPPPPAKPRRIGIYIQTALLGVALLLVVGLVLALLHQPGLFGRGGHSPVQTGPGVQATATHIAACTTPAINSAAARTLAHVQMTTGLRDSAHQDYRPVDNVSSFMAGTQGYLTFQIATAQAGTVAVRFCLPSQTILGTLQVPRNAQQRYGEFAVRFAGGDVGRGVATLTWNGAVAATVAFAVRR